MTFAFNYVYPEIALTQSSNFNGCILISLSSEKLMADEFLRWFDTYFQQVEALGPARPPTKVDLLLLNTKKFSAQAMLVLAFLGWILPVMPGTPFFLIAWALGWRPKGSKH